MLAKAALLGFLPFALLVFKHLPRAQAASIVVVVGSILLPDRIAIDLPVIPPMDKEYITYLSALVAAYVYRPRAVARARFLSGLELIVIPLFLLNIATAARNGEPMMDEGKLEEGLGLWWLIAQTADDFLTLSVPYFVGRAIFSSLRDLYAFMGVLSVSAIGYTVLIAIEFFMSIPFRVWHLNQMIYGIPLGGHPNFRWGLTQPIVFFDNGLALASFMAVTLIATAALAKAELPLPRPAPLLDFKASRVRYFVAAGLLMTLNVAGITYGLSILVAHITLRPRVIAMLGIVLMALAITYPALRMADAFPHRAIVEFAAEHDAARAKSLGGRFDEEDFVLGQLGDRFWVGWGTYLRTPGAQTFGEGEGGLDGWWTMRLGSAGMIGVVLYYAMFAIPAYRAWRSLGRIHDAGVVLVGALICMVSVRAIDLLINGWWNCLPVFLAGLLSGVVGGLGRDARSRASGSDAERRIGIRQ